MRSKDNLSNEQRNALRSLQEDMNITIKPAGKGGGVVVFDTQDYERRAEGLLSVKEHYRQVPLMMMDKVGKETEEVINKGLLKG
ncbi:hypothetical protein NDU88_005342 [Pleurodeles waltl]|uniref:Uncharacterized protein n=1 Tax=Pleurodeles waltl TaxID=8319 RepID=A0AAV7LNU4_PLEWA|nr:hypothetical protein NDU88_005342 [Pleurodeles waltl]